MPWKPVHEAHAIERVRASVRFDAIASPKVIEKSGAEILSQHMDFDFDEISRVPSGNVLSLKLDVAGGHGALASDANVDEASKSWSLRMTGDGAPLEELRFGGPEIFFVTTRYGRWAHLTQRLEGIFYPILEGVRDSVNFQSARLEYWDRFIFDGEPDAADFADVIVDPNRIIPRPVIADGGLWHSHTGWFESVPTGRLLINQNFDAVDQSRDEGPERRTVGIYTLVEYRPDAAFDDCNHLREMLEKMHKRSNILLGSDLTAEIREAIGLNLEEYQ